MTYYRFVKTLASVVVEAIKFADYAH